MRAARHFFLVLSLGSLALSCAQGTDPAADTFERPKSEAGVDSQVEVGTTEPEPEVSCGNGVVEEGEACDRGNLADRTCQTEGFASGALLCTPDCQLDTRHCGSCGNGLADEGEECDGSDLGAATTCADIGAGSADEALICSNHCTYDLSNCSACGDGTIAPPEDCEPATPTSKAILGGATCESLGWQGGNLDCRPSCRFDESGCHTCGDGKKSGIEQCDGADFAGKGCGDFAGITGAPFTSGTLGCTSDCRIDTSNCMLCGDGVVTGNEVCDVGALEGKTCATQGFTGGDLACAVGCASYNTSACTLCGNGNVEGAEQCDGQNLAGATCISLGFSMGGALSCSPSCTFNTSNCSNNTCGDGIINGADACDCGSSPGCTASQLNNKTCASFNSPSGTPYAGGTLGCLSPHNCSFDYSGCYYCGDGKVDPGEACDGTSLGGKTCVSLGFVSGNLTCNSNCQLNSSACVSVPNPLILCSSPNLPLVDNAAAGKTDTISVGDTGQVVDVDVMVRVPHSWPGDVVVKLTHGTTTRTLIDQPGVPGTIFGCSTHDIDCTLDDEGLLAVENACSATKPGISGILKPNQTLSAFDGQSMSGPWSLQVADVVAGLTGTFAEWCLVVTWQ